MPYAVRFPTTFEGVFHRRENRFVVWVAFGGEMLRIHLPNSGRLRFLRPGVPVRFVRKPSEKTVGRLLMARDEGVWVLLDSSYAEAALEGLVARWEYRYLAPQPRLEGRRLDALIEDAFGVRPLEMKSATHVEGAVACFPDAPSTRARRHLEILRRTRGVLVFALLNPRARAFWPCRYDPEFARAFHEAVRGGLEVHAVRAKVDPQGMSWAEEVPVYSTS